MLRRIRKSSQRIEPEGARSKTRLLGALAVLLVLALISFFVGTRFQSPRQAASKASEPNASWITAGVGYGVMTERIVTRGQLAAEGSVKINAPSSVSGTQVVTKTGPKVGATVKEGELLLAISGRPIFLCAGQLPTYRLMQPSDTGDDIKQLQNCLRRLGYGTTVTGKFDLPTSIALLQLYEKFGFQTIRTQVTDAQIAQSKKSLDSATRAVDDAVSAQTDGIQLRQAKRQVDVATEKKRTAQSDVEKKLADDQLLAAQESLTSLNQSLQQSVDRAHEQQQTAESSYTELLSKWGPTIPVGEIIFAPVLPAVVQTTESILGAVVSNSTSSATSSGSLPSSALSSPSISSSLLGGGGSTGTNAIAVLSSTKPLIKATVPIEKARYLKSGLAVTISVEATNQTVNGKIQLNDVGDGASPLPNNQFTVIPDAEIPAALIGSSFRITLNSAQTKEKVLFVPVAAVTTGPNGSRRVTVVKPDNKTLVDVDVSVGLTTGGNSEVVPASPGILREGDRVVIGQ